MPKLVKDKVVKLPRSSGSVGGTLRRALIKAQAQGWTKVVVVGEGRYEGHVFWSTMPETFALGLCEQAKNGIMDR